MSFKRTQIGTASPAGWTTQLNPFGVIEAYAETCALLFKMRALWPST